jgi:predicted RNase H-like HicB family nuclease
MKRKPKYDYSVNLAWSNEDKAYLASVPELPGCMADGPTLEAALANVRQIAREWVEVAMEEGREVPEPLSIENILASRKLKPFSRNQYKEIVETVLHDSVPKILPDVLQEIAKTAMRVVVQTQGGRAYIVDEEGRRHSLKTHAGRRPRKSSVPTG